MSEERPFANIFFYQIKFDSPIPERNKELNRVYWNNKSYVNFERKYARLFHWHFIEVESEWPTFAGIFEQMRDVEDRLGNSYDGPFSNVHIVCNADIMASDSWLSAPSFFARFFFVREGHNFKICYALSRWDYVDQNTATHFNRPDSQDAWVFFGAPKHFVGADFRFGIPGCDNKIAYLLKENGYDVWNPSLDMKAIHLHQVQSRTYIEQKIPAVPPPYHLVVPCTIQDVFKFYRSKGLIP